MLEKELPLLAIELPEDILKAKWCGDFKRALRLIDLRCGEEKTPGIFKRRLQLEKEILQRLPLDYAYSVPEALALMQKDIPDFTMEELDRILDSGKTDWIYIDGQIHLATRFFENLKDVDPVISSRVARNKGTDASDNLAQNADFEETPNSQLKNLSMNTIRMNGSRRDRIRILATLRIKDEAFRPGPVMVHLPIPKPQVNMKDIVIDKISPEPSESCKVTVAPEDAPQRTVCWEAELAENTTFEVEYEYTAEAVYHDLSRTAADLLMDGPAIDKVDCTAADLSAAVPHIAFTPTIRSLVEELCGDIQNPDTPEGKLQMARAFYNYCTTNVTYSYMRSYFTLEQIPEYAALGRKGDCGVQALLFITLCRAAGIPARWQSGLYVTPAFKEMQAEAGCHDWALFYVEPWGWLFADPSFGGSAYRAGNLDRWNYYFGNLDTFRMAANSQFQAPFMPPKTQSRNDPYDNQTGEAEYPEKALFGEDTVRTQTVWMHQPI